MERTLKSLATSRTIARNAAAAVQFLGRENVLQDQVVKRRAAGRVAAGNHGFRGCAGRAGKGGSTSRSEEHTSELQSLMRTSYAVFCLKKKKQTQRQQTNSNKRQ